MAKFKSPRYAGLVISGANTTTKFAGGFAEVDDEHANAIRSFAEAHPEYAIEEIDAGPPAQDPATGEGEGEDTGEGEAKDPTNDELRAELKERGLPTTGNKDELLARLAESDDPDEG